jgi:hypothetical protein
MIDRVSFGIYLLACCPHSKRGYHAIILKDEERRAINVMVLAKS